MISKVISRRPSLSFSCLNLIMSIVAVHLDHVYPVEEEVLAAQEIPNRFEWVVVLVEVRTRNLFCAGAGTYAMILLAELGMMTVLLRNKMDVEDIHQHSPASDPVRMLEEEHMRHKLGYLHSLEVEHRR